MIEYTHNDYYLNTKDPHRATTVFTWPFLAQKGVLRNLARFLTASVASTNLWTSLDLGLKYTPSLWVPLVTCISPKSVLTSTST